MRVHSCIVFFLLALVPASLIGSALSMPRLIFRVPPEKYILCPDVNGDGQVNSVDLMIVSISFGATPRSANWDSTVDVNRDGIVDILDAVRIAAAHADGLLWPLI